MRIFVLCTGRCGSTTFAKACSHITNYTSAHESGRYVDWSYPDNHIEIDNRLSWFLGSLASRYPEAEYIRLSRRREDVVRSFERRQQAGSPLLHAYRSGICQLPFSTDEAAAEHFVDAVQANIFEFLAGRKHWHVEIEEPKIHFSAIWRQIAAQGNLDAALREFDIRYNEGK